jgi:PHD/YefM family antitoxin component YafN of YafNO toxin-antitoxin module
MNTIPAQEIKRRGIAAVDELIAKGDVYIIRNNQPQYVVLSQERYQELLEAQEEAQLARIRASLEDLKAGRVKRGTAEDLIRELNLED